METSDCSRYYCDLVFNGDREEKISSPFLALPFLTPSCVSFLFLLVISVSFPSQYKLEPTPEPSDEEEDSSEEEEEAFGGAKKKKEEEDPAASEEL